MSVLDDLKWRYATKRMNGQKVPSEKLENILEAIQLAPTSIGLQPFTVLVVEDPELLARIAPAIRNQPQITEGSHVLIFAAWTEISDLQVEKYLDNIAAVRGISIESLAGMQNMIKSSLARKTPEQLLDWTSRQAYIAIGVGLVAAAEAKVDATPMEGFDPDGLDALLGLNEQGLHSTVILTLGYRDTENDQYSSAAKVRRNIEDLFVRI